MKNDHLIEALLAADFYSKIFACCSHTFVSVRFIRVIVLYQKNSKSSHCMLICVWLRLLDFHGISMATGSAESSLFFVAKQTTSRTHRSTISINDFKQEKLLHFYIENKKIRRKKLFKKKEPLIASSNLTKQPCSATILFRIHFA